MKYWQGDVPKECQGCFKPITDIFIDANIRTAGGNIWACVCPDCHKAFGNSQLGIGKGQKYEKQNDGKFLKVG